MELDRILQGFDDRMKNIAVFSSIINLQSKTRYSEYPLESIGLATLLYMLDNMLLNKITSTEGLNTYLQVLLAERCAINLNIEQVEEFRIILVQEFLRNEGAPHEFEYYNFEKSETEKYAFHLIEYDNLDITELKEKRSNLKLTDKGIEMLFKTKEMYNELQISITQLYFKQQMQKGLFNEALKAVTDIIGLIRSEKSKMRDLHSDIIRDAIGVSKRNELEQRLLSIHEKMGREKEVFYNLKILVDDKLDSYHRGELSEKEEKGIDLILAIQRQLFNAMSIHESLFDDKQKLQLAMTNALESLVLNAFSVKLNFEREILHEAVRKQLGTETLRQILNPIFPLKKTSIFNPAQIFMPQKRQQRKIEREMELPEIDEEMVLRMDQEEKEREQKRQERINLYLRIVLLPLLQNEETTISKILQELKEASSRMYDEVTSNMHFYSFLVDLHQSDYNEFKRIKKDLLIYLPTISRSLALLVEEHPDFEEIGHFSFFPTKDCIELESGYRLSDFIIKRGNLYAVLQK